MTLHTILSYVKSGIRILGFLALAAKTHVTAAILLILAEVVGIFEELPGSYVGTETESDPCGKSMPITPQRMQYLQDCKNMSKAMEKKK